MSNQFALSISQWLSWLLKEAPGEIQPIPFTLGDIARQNDKRPAWVKLFVPDGWAQNIKGNQKLLDTYIAIRIPGELMSRWNKIQEQYKKLREEKEKETEGEQLADESKG